VLPDRALMSLPIGAVESRRCAQAMQARFCIGSMSKMSPRYNSRTDARCVPVVLTFSKNAFAIRCCVEAGPYEKSPAE